MLSSASGNFSVLLWALFVCPLFPPPDSIIPYVHTIVNTIVCTVILCPKVTGSPLTYRARAGAPRTLANARRWVAGGVLAWLPVRVWAVIIVLYPPAAKPPHPPPPQGEGGRGEGAHRQPPPSGPRGRARRRAARGGAAPPNEGRGRTTAPGTSAGSPTRRAAPVRRTPNQTKRLSFVRLAGDWAPGQLLTKLAFCWVRPVVAAAELWRRCAPLRISGKSSEKRVMGR